MNRLTAIGRWVLGAGLCFAVVGMGIACRAEDPDPLADPDKLYAEELQDDNIQRVLRMVPRRISEVLEPPADWQTLRFDSIELKLPLGTNWFVFVTNTNPNWLVLSAYNEATNRFGLSDLGPHPELDIPYPAVSFQDMFQHLNTVPDDFHEAESVEQKREVVTRLLVKAVNQSKYIREWVFVETPTLKAMIQRSPESNKGYGSVHVSVWNHAGTIYFYTMAAVETSPSMGQQILGGVRFHGDSISAERVKADINRLAAGRQQPTGGGATISQ
jgi:hypothetical protein